jgi:NitT/TauT family transport system permease protein
MMGDIVGGAAPVAVASAATGRRSVTDRISSLVREYLPAIAVFVGVVIGWEILASALNLRQFILPRPSAIGAAFVAEWSTLRVAATNTLIEAVGGLAIGVALGVLAAFAVARWGRVRDVVVPVAIAISAVPIIALAPIMSNWFGITNPLAKMAVVILLVFFPIMINVVRGLTEVPSNAIELMRANAASDGEILRKLRFPNALPYFFTGLKVATTLCLIGAVVAEYFGGSSEVLGRVIVQNSSRLRFDITWSAILVTAAVGIAFYLLVLALERLVIPWHASLRELES